MEKNSKFQFYPLLDWTSLYLDDCPEIGAFTYRMRGFKNHTPIHYFKNYQIKFVKIIYYFMMGKMILAPSCSVFAPLQKLTKFPMIKTPTENLL